MLGIDFSDIHGCEMIDDSSTADQLENHKLRSYLEHGYSFHDLGTKTRPGVGDHTLDCLRTLHPGESRYIRVQNPNLDAINGLFFSIRRDQSYAKVSRVNVGTEIAELADPEVIC